MAENGSVERAVLSPLDQMMPTTYIKVFFVIPSQDPSRSIASLREGLSKTHSQLPYLGGQLVSGDLGRPFVVEWSSDQEPVLVEIVAPEGLSSMSGLKHDSLAAEWLDRVTPLSALSSFTDSVERTPVLVLRGFSLQDGVALSVACHHCLWDIGGLSMFMNLWATNTANGRQHSTTTILDHLGARDARVREAIARSGLVGHPISRKLIPQGRTGQHRLRHIILRIDMNRLRNQYAETDRQKLASGSTMMLLYAILWSRIDKARTTSRGRPSNSRLRILRDARRLIFDDVQSQRTYMGNVFQDVFCHGTHNTNDDTASIARKQLNIYHALKAAETSAQSVVDIVAAVDQCHPNLLEVRETPRSYNDDTLTISSWVEAPMFVDFGCDIGKVDAVRLAPVDYASDGLMIVMPRKKRPKNILNNDDGHKRVTHVKDRDGVLEVFICLKKDDIEALSRDSLLNFLADEEDVETKPRL